MPSSARKKKSPKFNPIPPTRPTSQSPTLSRSISMKSSHKSPSGSMLAPTIYYLLRPPPPTSTPFPTRRSSDLRETRGGAVRRRRSHARSAAGHVAAGQRDRDQRDRARRDRKSTRLNSSHSSISYAVFCSKKKIT